MTCFACDDLFDRYQIFLSDCEEDVYLCNACFSRVRKCALCEFWDGLCHYEPDDLEKESTDWCGQWSQRAPVPVKTLKNLISGRTWADLSHMVKK